MPSVSRSSVLYAVVLVALIAALPGAIAKIIRTGDPYLFTERFFQDILARLSGPGRLRFIVQPTVAIFLGLRSGIKDAQLGLPPFLWALTFHKAHRRQLYETHLLQSGISSQSRFCSMSFPSFLSFTTFVPVRRCWSDQYLSPHLMF